MRTINRVSNFFNQHYSILYLLVFIVALSLFTYLQFDATFADPDSFYHAKAAELLRDKGAITEFPWLSATTLKYYYIDHHFLYHLLLIPFVSLFPPLVGLKIATILFAAIAIVIIFWFLNQLKVRGAFWYTLFLLTINPFIFRLNLAKAQGLVLVFLFLGLYFLLNRYYLSLLFLTFLYVWLYGGWPLLLVFALVYLLVNWFISRRQASWLVIKRVRKKINRQSLYLLISVVLGVLVGLFFSPYFIKNLYFYWQQSFKIALINYQNIIGVGGEWYPYQPSDLFLAATPLFLLLIFALVLFIINYQKQTINSWLFLIYTFLFLALTLKSRRNVEYFVPFALCFSAITLTIFLNSFEKHLKQLRVSKIFILSPIIILLALSPLFYRDLSLVKQSYQEGFSWTKFSQPAEWLKNNTPKNSIVFHSDWDEFPLLFYHNDHNYYLVGLDPTFMYEYDKDLYRRWVDITTGKQKENLYSIIRNLFGADYVFVDFNQNSDFDQNLANNFYFEKVFENQEAKIYHLVD